MNVKIFDFFDIFLINLINELLNSQFSEKKSLNNSQYNFSMLKIYKILIGLKNKDINKFYLNILYMNRNCKIGSLALSYSKTFKSSILEMDYYKLKKLMKICTVPEFDSNEYLNSDDFSKLKNEIKNSIISLNLLIDDIVLNSKIPNIILDHDVLNRNRTSILQSDYDDYNIVTNNNNCIFLPTMYEKNTIVVSCLSLSELMDYFCINIKNLTPEISERFKFELFFVKKFLDIFP